MLRDELFIDGTPGEVACEWDDVVYREADRRGVRNREFGKRGENAAARYLELMDYEILERNWTCPAGEADIIARQGEIVVFVEVKTRTDISKGFPSEAVTQRKRDRYERIAAYYLRNYDEVDVPFRFDIIGILVLSEDRGIIKHYVNAYGFGN